MDVMDPGLRYLRDDREDPQKSANRIRFADFG